MTAQPVWGPRSSIERVYEAILAGDLRPTNSGSNFFALCPVHPENTGSLHVTYTAGGQGGGKTMLYCQGCHAPFRDIVEALGLTVSDTFDDPPPERPRSQGVGVVSASRTRRSASRRQKLGPLPKRLLQDRDEPDHEHQMQDARTPAAVYHYADGAGVEVQRVLRLQCTHEGCTKKSFTQRFVNDAGDLVHKAPAGFTPVLYRQPEVLAAVAAGEWVWLLEGEKDVHTAEQLGVVATTNPGGAGNFTAELAQLLTGARVRVVVDQDAAGWDRAATLADELTQAGAAEVVLLLPAVTEPHADLTDHVEAGHGLEDLVEVTAQPCRAWGKTRGCDDAAAKVSQAAAEAHAQHQHAEELRAAGGAKRTIEQHVRNGKRWAKEAEICAERFLTALDRVLDVVEEQPTTVWVEQLQQRLANQVDTVEAATRSAHEIVEAGIAQSLLEVLAQARARAVRPPAAAPAEEPAAETAAGQVIPLRRGGSDGGGGGNDGGDGIPREEGWVSWGHYAFVNGGIARMKQDGWSPVINVQVRLDFKEWEEDSSEEEDQTRSIKAMYGDVVTPLQPRKALRAVSYVYSYWHPVSQEWVQMRVPAERVNDGSWLDSIDVPGVAFSPTRNGRAEVVRAIEVVSATHTVSRTQIRGTGWRKLPDAGWAYSHWGGVITATGWQPHAATFDGSMHRYFLPRPSTDPAALRAAFLDHSAAMVTKLPGRVGVALCAVAYKAAIERVPFSTVLYGPPGSRKSGLAALAMHHYGPEWDRDRPTASMTLANGDTSAALRICVADGRHAMGHFDDVTPGGSRAKAQEHMGALIQMLYNAETRNKSSRDGYLMAGRRPEITALLTSEIAPRVGANARRAIVLPLTPTDTDLEQIRSLDEYDSRLARAQLTASMLQWVAADLEQIRTWVTEQRRSYTRHLEVTGHGTEEAEYCGHLWAGWALMLRFLAEAGALTKTEANDWTTRVHELLGETMQAAADAEDRPTTAGQAILEALRGALRSGDLYLSDVTTGGQPTADPGLGRRIGWSLPPQLDTKADDRFERPLIVGQRAQWIGYLSGQEVLLQPGAVFDKALKVASAALPDPIAMDTPTALTHLRAIGALKIGAEGKNTVKRVIHAETSAHGGASRQRMVVLDLAVLLGDDDEPDDTLPTPPAPQSPPALFDTDAAPELTTAPGGTSPHPGQGVEASPSQQEADLMEQINQRAHMLAEPTECVHCHQITRTGLEGVPLHPSCWVQLNAELDQMVQTSAHTAAAAADEPAPASSAAAPVEPMTPSPAPSRQVVGERAVSDAPAAAAAVFDLEQAYLPDGTTHRYPDQVTHLGQVATFAHDVLGLGVQRGTYRDAGTVVITDDLADHLQIPVTELPDSASTGRSAKLAELTKDHPALLQARESGWLSGQDSLRPTTLLKRADRDRVRVTFASLLPEQLTTGAGDPGAIARRLHAFAAAVGMPWHASHALTGFDLMKSLRRKDRAEIFIDSDPVPPASAASIELDIINWTRTPMDHEAARTFVHVYDRGGAHLAGVGGLELPIGEPVHYPEPIPFDAKKVGYWKIRAVDAADWRMPHPVHAGHLRGNVWVTTPTLQLATELGYSPEILEAYLWPRHARFLDTWKDRLRDARAQLDTPDRDDQAARDLVKAVYTRTIGMMGSAEYSRTGQGHYMPERRHLIVAKARSNLLRQINTIGTNADAWPLVVSTDALWYASDEPDPVKAWPGDPAKLGRGLGQFKHEGTGTMTDLAPYFVTGHPFDQKEALTLLTQTPDGGDHE